MSEFPRGWDYWGVVPPKDEKTVSLSGIPQYNYFKVDPSGLSYKVSVLSTLKEEWKRLSDEKTLTNITAKLCPSDNSITVTSCQFSREFQ
jgi:hypothetical protein